MDEKILQGNAARETQLPWQVSIHVKNLFDFPHCSGSLIAPDIILTAAHCVDRELSPNASNTFVEAGHLHMNTYNIYTQYRPVSQLVADVSHGSTLDGIALLKLHAPFDLQGSDGHVGTVCLPSAEYTLSGNVTIAGWEKTAPEFLPPMELAELTLPVQDNSMCMSTNVTGYDSTTMFCAGVPGMEACVGNLGSPLVQRKDGVYTVVGIVSTPSATNCGALPRGYTRVSAYAKWISQKTAELHSG